MKALKSNAIGRCAKPSQMRRLVARVLVAAGVMALATQTQAINVTMNASDVINTTSFNTGLHWNNSLAPSVGNDYFTSNFTLRTPTSGAHAFAGDSLQIDAGGTLGFKTPGVITVNDLRMNGGLINQAAVGGLEIATLAGNLQVVANSSINSAATGRTMVVNSTITGGSNLSIQGPGVTQLSGNNTGYTGTVTANSNLTITNSNALGATGGASVTNIIGANGSTGSTLILSGSALTIAETLNFNANAIGRSGLTNNNAFNQVLNGPIDVSSTVNLVQWNSSGTGSITINGDITGTMTGGSLLFLRGSSTSVNNRILGSMNIIGGNFAKTDDGVWTIGNAGETYSWNNTQVARGTVRLNLANMLPSATIVTVGQGTDPAAATLDLNGFNQTVSGLSKLGAGTNKQITNTSGTAAILTVNNAAASNYAGRINGNLGLTKSGVGTLTLADINGYSGNTVINQGTLALGSAGSIDNSPVISIGTGATFNVSAATGYNLVSGQSIIGNGSILGDVIADAGSLLSPGFSVGDIGTLAFVNSLDINGSVLIEVDAAAAGQKIDIINVDNVLDISGASLTFSFLSAPGQNAFVFSNYGSLVGEFANISVLPVGYQVQYNFGGNNQIALVSIPEPATMSLLALGGLAMLRRRRVMR